MTEKHEERQNEKQPNKIKNWAFKIAKATIKAAVVYLIFLIGLPYFSFFSSFIPGLVETIEVFVIGVIMFTILGDLAVGTVYEYIFDASRSIFTIVYIIFVLNNETLNIAYASFYLTVDLNIIGWIIALLVLLGLARSILQAIDFMGKRAKTRQVANHQI